MKNNNIHTVLVTGGTSGIGLSLVSMLANKGCTVYAASRSAEEKVEFVGSGKIIFIKTDVTNKNNVEEVVRKIYDDGSLDVVVSNAGNGIAGAIEDCSEEEVRYQMETNFFGAVNTIQACLPYFRKQNFGKIIVTSSVAGIVPIPYQAFYSASKAAILMMMQVLQMELKTTKIQCCTVLPGDTKTGFTSARKYTKKSTPNSFYYAMMTKALSKMEQDETNGVSADFVAKKIMKQIFKTMKSVVVPGFQYKFICWIYPLLPKKISRWILGILY